MKIIRNLITMELSESDHENLCTVVTLLNDLKENLQEHGEDSIQSNGKCVDIDELDDVIYYLKFFANAREFIIE